MQLRIKCETKYFSEGSIIADSRELATGLMVITSGFANVELPMDSEEADEEHSKPDGKTLPFVFGRGYVYCDFFFNAFNSKSTVWLSLIKEGSC